jgi:hypothetical protein
MGLWAASTGAASTGDDNSSSQTSSTMAMILKVMEQERDAPLRENRDFWSYIGSIFSCLILGICSTPASIQCGLQGTSRSTYIRSYDNDTEEERIVGGSVAATAEFPWAAALSLGKVL